MLDRSWADGRYTALALLGRGSSGLVYRVHDREDDAVVALKTLAELDPEHVYRLKQEFRACAGVRHRNLVELYELYAGEEECFFTMELVDGVDFVRAARDGRAPDGGVRLARFFSIARQLVQGLAVLHAAGRLHRDVKPPNCLVDAHGRTVLLDFGFMIQFGGRLLAMERSDTIAGSLAYMAPEILRGEPVTPPSDWYSVGVVLYEALTGALPFSGPPADFLSREARRPPPPVGAGVPPAMADMVAALLATDPRQRPDAAEVARVIDGCSAEQRLATLMPLAPLADETPFVGRHAELAILQGALEALVPGRTSIVQVSGPSGMGKTELVRHFLSRVEASTDTVALRGRCHPYETVPYRAFDGVVDALSRYLDLLPESQVAELMPRHAGALVRLFPVLGRLPPFAEWRGRDDSEDVVERRRRGFAALRELLARLGDRRRLVVWIDDVQWADSDSVALAREIFGGVDPPSLLLLLSHRSEEPGAAPEFAALDVRRTGGPTRATVALGPLGDAEAAALAGELGRGRDADMAAVVRDAGGSPFFVTQLARCALGERPLASAAAAGSLSGIVQTRVGQLSRSSRELLEIVCVAGRPMPLAVAAAAGSLGGSGRHEMITLQEERLLRLAQPRGAQIEAYHDRIREAVVGGLSPAALRERHRGLAHALLREPEPDAAALYRHFSGAEEREPAATWAVEAARRADDALAFGEAAAFYRAALALRDGADGGRAELLVALANALVNAGRGAEAAPLFVEAAATDGGLGGLELRRRAAEQYMQTGRLDEGVANMQALLAALDLAYPRNERHALRGVLGGLIGLALRGAQARRPSPLTDRERLRIETARSAAKGLAMVDPLRGLYFAVRSLRLALRSGDPYFAGRELAGVSATLIPVGPPFRAWAGRMLRRARRLAEALDDPYLLGFTAIVEAQERMVQGDWADMLRSCDHGSAILRDRCRGVTWELGIASTAAERALEELGRLDEMQRRLDAALAEARETADIVRIVACIQSVGMVALLRGRTAEARAAAQQSRRAWPGGGFQMQHFYALRLDAYAALAEDRAGEADELLRAHWPTLVRTQLLRHALIGFDAHLLAARIGLGVAHATPGRRLSRRFSWHARCVGRATVPAAAAHEQMLRAGAAAVAQDVSAATLGLRAAASGFARAQMRLAQAAALHGLARLDAAAGAAELPIAAALLADAGITDVAGYLRLYGLPGGRGADG
ncbi:MAG: protein kinase [Deltaproteobacteria bacterium]|nr:protein kinase [Deltaproteobacteria bacterium]